MSITVITSIYGGYDALTPVPEQTVDARWICVTDMENYASAGWEVIVEKRPHMHPRVAAKIAKCMPWLYTDSTTVVWIDGSCKFLTPHTLESIIEGANGAPLAQIKHPWRDCIYDEAEESAKLLKYQGQAVLEQANYYRRFHPEHWGLWATGMIVRNGLPDWVQMMGHGWISEQVRWTYQDQLSQAPILQQINKRPAELPFSLHGNGLFEWWNHASEA